MLDHSQVRALLRQRPPMLLLDTVREFSPPASLVATKAVTAAEDCYRSLEDGSGIEDFAYPLALLLESFGQAASVLWSLAGLGPAGEVPLMAGLRDLVFAAPTVPGDVLEHQVRLQRHSGTVCEFTGQTQVAGRTVLTVGSLLVVSRSATGLLSNPASSTATGG
ncbi:3-hydroxyacyl-ACP dehydratase FabZ family protein [Streptomyces sp. NBC_00564]|uniref:3-hydroxyacyl-ACP dehydratase FabZ family protein n=1 Tax=Streptomyces sp. NBC_00564 TaxID=2903663 RepID=UPI00352E6F48|nr:beta-hydroxyacyl-ACP dehydratase [Streptomyces sp. NBC_00564]